MAGIVSIPWYATVFRGDQLETALKEIAPLALRYGATEYTVYRSRDDRYKFMQTASFEDGADFDRYWYGPEFSRFRSEHSGWYQVPILHYWNDQVAAGAVEAEPVASD